MNTPPEIYNVNPVTGEYLGAGVADADPLVEGAWLIPAHAYLDEPPAFVAGEVAVRGEVGWRVVPDLRGTVYSTETGEASTHSELGELPAGLTTTPRPSLAHLYENGEWVLDESLADELEQASRNSAALEYLSQTDWYVIRQQETGVSMPDEIVAKRAAAREVVVR